jgi:short-subunit dehydrogenase
MERKGRGLAMITGASSGIGAAFARRLARRGHDLLLTGRRREKLAELARELEGEYSVRAQIVIAELSDRRELAALEERVRGLELAFLVNNAGYGQGRFFDEESIDGNLRMVEVHAVAAMRLTHAALPGMLARGAGAIINVSSLAALFPLPRNVAYCSTKMFLMAFSESLYMELAPRGIVVQALLPGFTRSDFHRRMGTRTYEGFGRRLVWMPADKVVRIALRRLGNGRVICIPGAFNRFLALLRHLIPKRAYYRWVSRGYRSLARGGEVSGC